MATSSILGFPRIGAFRELKKAQEAYWKGNMSEAELKAEAKTIREYNRGLQADAGLTTVATGDFTFYDHILDMIATVGAIPARYNFSGDNVDLDTFFAMARGSQTDGKDVVAMEMTKWFDTNYHYIVPEFDNINEFKVTSSKIVDEYKEARVQVGSKARPVLVGPVTFLTIGKDRSNRNPLELLSALLPVYTEILAQLKEAGATEVQIDEPILSLNLTDEQRNALGTTYDAFASSGLNINLTTYFGELRDNLDTYLNLPVASLHFDLSSRGINELDTILAKFPSNKKISLGLVDGRNIWKNNLEASIKIANKVAGKFGAENVIIASSCSLLHTPVNLDSETKLDDEFKGWLSFAKQKIAEVATITKAVNGEDVSAELTENKKCIESRATSTRIHNTETKVRADGVAANDYERDDSYSTRVKDQIEALKLPLFPTTTIGSFPQTKDLRKTRADFKKGNITREQYDAYIAKLTDDAVKWQEEIGIDMLVHGEFERNDMVEYFGEKLEGYAFTKFGWVQSYGSRCVKPPIIFGDVSRPTPMTVRWSKYTVEQSDLPVKGMLTGPITMLQWAFVRDDQPRSETCKQIALAIRDEVVDLEEAGIKAIQIDEPAIREGLPLRNEDKAEYLKWAVDAFKLSAAGVQNKTQIHTHMCYSEFNDIMGDIARMDADVISIETSRSAMELLDAFVEYKYPLEIGPGVYDIHSPRIPSKQEMRALLDKALEVLKPEQVWVNPDCGLKTRGWAEVKPALEEMVNAAKELREEYTSKAA